MPLSRIYPDVHSELFNLNGINHKIVMSANYYIAHSDVPFSQLPQLDRLNDDARLPRPADDQRAVFELGNDVFEVVEHPQRGENDDGRDDGERVTGS